MDGTNGPPTGQFTGQPSSVGRPDPGRPTLEEEREAWTVRPLADWAQTSMDKSIIMMRVIYEARENPGKSPDTSTVARARK